jgi:hypothetical protein
MPYRFLCRAVVIAVLSVALIAPARAEGIDTAAKQITAGIVVASVAVGVLVVFLIIHYKHKRSSVTGCVISARNGVSITDESDKRTYALSGYTGAVKAGERMKIEGKRQNEKNGTFSFEVQKVSKVFGACQP